MTVLADINNPRAAPRMGDLFYGTDSGGVADFDYTFDQLRMGAISVKDYGAVGDGVADDTAAIQATIDAATTGISASARVVFPGGTYKIESSLIVDQIEGMIIEGAGVQATQLRWTADDNTDNLFEVSNCINCLFQNFTIRASSTGSILGACFRLSNVTAISHSQTRIIFSNVFMDGVHSGFKYGIFWDDTGADDQNNDLCTMRNVQVHNYETYAFWINHSQSKQHKFYDCFVAGPVGINAVRFVAGPNWYGGGIFNTTGAAFFADDINDQLLVSGLDSETCDRFVEDPGGATSAFPITLISNRFATNGINADKKVIKLTENGCLTMIGNIFNGSDPVIISHLPGQTNPGSKDIIIGNHFNLLLGTDANPFEFLTDDHSEATVFGNTYSELGGGSTGVTIALGTFTDGDTTPLVVGLRKFHTANTSPTTITMFDGGVASQELTVVFGDSDTTIDFTGTNLKGNSAIDWSPKEDDHMTCIFDGADWFCNISDNTAGSLVGATDSITSGTTQTQVGATALTSAFNRVTTHGNTDDGVKLPLAIEGSVVTILNDTATADLQVWPATGDAIEAASVDAVGVTKIAAGVSTTYRAVDATTWYITDQHTTP